MEERRELVIGTRGSTLALKQADIVKRALIEADSTCAVTVKVIKTEGDSNLSPIPLDTVGKGWFTKEIEKELIEGNIDLAVHSLKDLPEELPEGLRISAYLDRVDPRDVLISKERIPFASLPEGALVGTDSQRRKVQILALRPDLRVESIRGNILTRIEKLESGAYDAIAIAAAGVMRLDMETRIDQYFPVEEVTPAPGQGILAIETRIDDTRTNECVGKVHDPVAADAALAERAFSAALGGGCKTPIGAYAEIEGDELTLHGMLQTDGGTIVRGTLRGPRRDAEITGVKLAKRVRSGKQEGGAVVLSGEKEALADMAARPEIHALHRTVVQLPTVSFRRRALGKEDMAALDDLARYDCIFFSSARAVHYFAELLKEEGIDPGADEVPHAIVVGPMTAKACSEAGLRVAGMPSTYTAAEMVRELAPKEGARVLFPRSTIAPEDTVVSIRNSGAEVTLLPLYETVERTEPLSDKEKNALAAAEYIVFLSPSSIRSFAKLAEATDLRITQTAIALCIGPRTERIAAEHGFMTLTALEHTVDGVFDMLTKLTRT